MGQMSEQEAERLYREYAPLFGYLAQEMNALLETDRRGLRWLIYHINLLNTAALQKAALLAGQSLQ